jgi:hypothetical protein
VRSARTVSEYTNGTQAMKMNITFCVSSMPNQRMVNGISAATWQVAAEQARAARLAAFEDTPRTGGDPRSGRRQNRQPEAKQHALQGRRDALHQRALVEQAREAGEHPRAGL